MSNSTLISYEKLSPNHSGERTSKICRITPHCFVGQCSVERIGKSFESSKNGTSSNYGIGYDGKIGLYVPENCRSWCSSSRDNDHKAVTIECASDNFEPYAMKAVVYNSLVKLCVDICKRNGKTVLLWMGDKEKTLSYSPKSNEMVLTVHRWFANKSCPGEWLYSRLGELAKTVTKELNWNSEHEDIIYRVQVGAFRNKQNAENYLSKIKKAGFPDAFIAVTKK